MTIKLNDAEFALLAEAVARGDKCISLPTKLSAARLRKVSAKLIETGFVRVVKAKAGSPAWRRDDEDGASYSLKLTAAGVKAAHEVEVTAEADPAASQTATATKPEEGLTNVGRAGIAADPPTGADVSANADAGVPPFPLASRSTPLSRSASEAPRSGSKIAKVIALLGGDDGVTISELIDATGWLPHTTRAALTGLRKRGYGIALDRSNRERGSVYRIEAQSTDPEPMRDEVAVEAP